MVVLTFKGKLKDLLPFLRSITQVEWEKNIANGTRIIN